MKTARELAHSVQFSASEQEPSLLSKAEELIFAGKGRSAYVFRIKGTSKVLKVFFTPFHHIAQEEAAIYRQLQGLSFYPTLYEYGDGYLVIEYIEGQTFYSCLIHGHPVEKAHIEAVDEALSAARERGLNPSDIHLQNIILTPSGEVKLIDVARFRQMKSCHQWNDLKRAFATHYGKWYFPKKMPVPLLKSIARLYKKNMLPRVGAS
ncbi:protein kinase family protein [Aureibacillus halotolerans]|uniref:Serine/threonine protein kinase n=1 Tax=Aureibacillus halotolerans TaxID=1508390 RepID=A0A4V3D680_9BACI|nr:protein kinase family protein [Aureibacillus halotolerans]TDQ42957.1 hypothetical protein EV213_101387 [Aureibacillus halotolerans]